MAKENLEWVSKVSTLAGSKRNLKESAQCKALFSDWVLFADDFSIAGNASASENLYQKVVNVTVKLKAAYEELDFLKILDVFFFSLNYMDHINCQSNIKKISHYLHGPGYIGV